MVKVITQKYIGRSIIERNICYIFLESFDINHRVSNIWACPTTGLKTLDLDLSDGHLLWYPQFSSQHQYQIIELFKNYPI